MTYCFKGRELEASELSVAQPAVPVLLPQLNISLHACFPLAFVCEFKTSFSTQATSSIAECQSSVPSTPSSPHHQLSVCKTDKNPFCPGLCRDSQGPVPPILRRPLTRIRQEGLIPSHHFQKAPMKASRFLITGWRLATRGRRFLFQSEICSGR